MPKMTGNWTRASVSGHACDLYEPPSRNELGLVLIYLHGYHLEDLRNKPAFVEQFDRHRLPVIVPWVGQSWWTDRICPEFDPTVSAESFVREGVLDFIRKRWGAEPPCIGLLGTSMGGQGALRMAYRFPRKFPVAAAISPAIDYQIRFHEGDEIIRGMYRDAEDVRQDTATLYIHPLNWPRYQFFCCDPTDHRWIDSSERLHMKLYSLGIPHECDLETEAGGHGFGYYNQMVERAVAFVVEGLKAMQ